MPRSGLQPSDNSPMSPILQRIYKVERRLWVVSADKIFLGSMSAIEWLDFPNQIILSCEL